MNSYVVFILISAFTYLLDEYNSVKCSQNILLSAFVKYYHHLFSTYLFLGSFLWGYHKIHLLISLLTLIHWLFIEECSFTTLYNKICGNEGKFKDILHFIFNKPIPFSYVPKYFAISVIIIHNSYNLL
jgi:hypothetical protein